MHQDVVRPAGGIRASYGHKHLLGEILQLQGNGQQVAIDFQAGVSRWQLVIWYNYWRGGWRTSVTNVSISCKRQPPTWYNVHQVHPQ